jgi:hypothetical protein
LEEIGFSNKIEAQSGPRLYRPVDSPGPGRGRAENIAGYFKNPCRWARSCGAHRSIDQFQSVENLEGFRLTGSIGFAPALRVNLTPH